MEPNFLLMESMSYTISIYVENSSTKKSEKANIMVIANI